MDVEDALIDALSRTTGYRIDGVNLALTGDGGALAWFSEGVTATTVKRPQQSAP